MSNYQQTLEAIHSYVDYSRTRQIPYNANTYNLDRMRALCALLDNPQDRFPSLHIAGSKGKGSTAAMAASILQTAGHRTALFTSPHLHSFRERLRIDGELIGREQLVALWEEARPLVESLERPTTFEIITALAFLHFSRPPVDWAVLEVGLGGRLDATNIVHPCACAITSLSYEHTDLLGHTLSLIAFEKAGIIKPGVPVVVGPQAPEAMAVLETVAAESGVQLWRVGEGEDAHWRWAVREATPAGVRLDITGPEDAYEDLWVPLAGYHQAANAAVAVALLHTLDSVPTPATIRQGLARAYWPGRLESVSLQPHIVVDSAHNRHSAEQLQAALALFPNKRLILLFGASSDKDIHGMLEVLGPEAAVVIVTRSFHPRASDPSELADLARSVLPHTPVYVTANVPDALRLAGDLAGPNDLVLVTGSIFVVADVRESWNVLHPQAFPPDDWVHVAEPIGGDGQHARTSPAPSGTYAPVSAASHPSEGLSPLPPSHNP